MVAAEDGVFAIDYSNLKLYVNEKSGVGKTLILKGLKLDRFGLKKYENAFFRPYTLYKVTTHELSQRRFFMEGLFIVQEKSSR